MESSQEPRTRVANRRTVVVVSVVALLVLGAIAASLLLFTDGSADDDAAGEPAVATRPDTPAVSYADPDGAYTVDVDPAWRRPADVTGSDETWETDVGDAVPTDSVTITAQAANGLDLDEYLQLVIKQAPKSVDEFTLREFRVVTLPTTVESAVPDLLGVVAYDGRRGAEHLAFFLVVSVAHDRAIVATLTTPKARNAEARKAVEPYLMTLRAK